MCNLLSHASFTSPRRSLTGKFAPIGALNKPLSSFTRRFAASLVAAPLMLGTVSVSAFVSAAPASAATYREHGAWQGFLLTGSGGEPLVGATSKMRKGGSADFFVKGDTLTLVLTDPAWDLRVNRHPPVRVQIDGESFTGTAVVSDRDFIEIPNIKMAVLKGFADGAQAVVNINGGDIVWTLDLDGFSAAMSDALKAYKVSYE